MWFLQNVAPKTLQCNVQPMSSYVVYLSVVCLWHAYITSSSAMVERPRDAWLTSFSIVVQLYSQNGNIAFLSHPLGDFRVMCGRFILGRFDISDNWTSSLVFMPMAVFIIPDNVENDSLEGGGSIAGKILDCANIYRTSVHCSIGEQRNRHKSSFICKNGKYTFWATIWGLRYAVRLYLIGKLVIAFLFVIIEHFCEIPPLRRYEWKSVEVGVFWRGRSFERKC